MVCRPRGYVGRRRGVVVVLGSEALIATPETDTWLGRGDRLLLHLGDSDRPASQRTDQPARRQHPDRRAQSARMRREGTQAAPHPATEEHHEASDRLASRDSCRARRVAVADQHRRDADQGRSRQARRPARPDCIRAMSFADGEERHSAHAAAHLRMSLLHAGIDAASIALWLGHANIQTTQVCLRAGLECRLVSPATDVTDGELPRTAPRRRERVPTELGRRGWGRARSG